MDFDKELKRLANNLEAKRKVVLSNLGPKWLLHPDNFIKKLPLKKPR